MSLIKDNMELDRLLESANFDEFKLVDSPCEQHDGSSQELLGVGPAPTMDTSGTLGLAPCEGINWVLCLLTLARGLLYLPPCDKRYRYIHLRKCFAW